MDTSNLTPITRSEMQGLKRKKETELYNKAVNDIVATLYGRAKHIAENKADTTSFRVNTSTNQRTIELNQQTIEYQRRCMNNTSEQREAKTPEYYLLNMSQNKFTELMIPDIIAGLELLFPDCSVKYITYSPTHDGGLCDISSLSEDTLRFLDRSKDKSYIVIDWS